MKLLIDASNAWYRAYTAAFLDNPGGAVMIMTYMLRRVCNEYGKNNVILCWDAGKSGRDILDKNYKGERQAVAGVWEDFPYMKSMVNHLGLSHAKLDGFEADDVIGSLAKKSELETRILSYDKDFYQLVDDRISILRPERTVQGKKVPQQIIDCNAVIEEFGCAPHKVILYKAFRGDASDNIPKISIRFTKNFSEQFYQALEKSSSVEEFYCNLPVFDKKYQQELLDFKERAFLNYEMVQIKTSLDVQIETGEPNSLGFKDLCQELNITKLKFGDWEEMPSEAPTVSPTQGGLF